MNKQCECCLSPNNLTELTDVYVNLIVSCFSVEVSTLSSLDKSLNHICNMCAVKINDCFTFRSQILISQIKLKRMYSLTINENMNLESNKSTAEPDPLKREILSDCEDTNDYDNSFDENNMDFQMDPKTDSNEPPVTGLKSSNYDSNNSSTEKSTTPSQRNWIVPIDHEFESNSNNFLTQKEETSEFDDSETNPSDETALNCEMCNKTFTTRRQLNSHRRQHFSNYTCDVCGKDFKQRAMLIRHMQGHLDYSRCTICSKLIKPSYMARHLKSHSGRAVYFKCTHCPEKLTSQHQRLKHMSSVHKVEICKYPCEACPKKFISPKKLRDHIDRSHLKKLNSSCDICGLKFFDMHALKKHMGAHSDERKFPCQFCDKRYKKKSHLKEHLPLHYGGRFKCTYCDTEYSNKNCLSQHIRTKHAQQQLCPPL